MRIRTFLPLTQSSLLALFTRSFSVPLMQAPTKGWRIGWHWPRIPIRFDCALGNFDGLRQKSHNVLSSVVAALHRSFSNCVHCAVSGDLGFCHSANNFGFETESFWLHLESLDALSTPPSNHFQPYFSISSQSDCVCSTQSYCPIPFSRIVSAGY